ncbi:DUF4184 family protein [Streptomyces sp. NBC_00385]|uniref:DUF4184 family protein n=1 Tax=Streptomyces sp. NBC_00385 TaxID=2975733 RepID=UPI002DDB1DFD|nr:DUF4184 family protein [Streptomyces sp. NBC_00385]WRZ07225.1 DUF4184 family protein [Streptomyces sp. NBC_00385]
MPFTLSHAAAVLPGIRRNGTGRGPLLASALVAGSFAPDMTYYADTAIPGAMEFGQVTHAWWGVFTVDVLITAATVALWLLLREPLVALLPTAWQGRVHAWVRGARRPPGRGPRGLRDGAWFVASAVIGAATHVVWDAFTHHDRWGVRLVPVLGQNAGGHPVFQLVQYGSSALALTVLAWFTVSGLRRTGARPVPASVPVLDHRARAWALASLGLCVLLGIAHRCARWYAYFGHVDTPLDIIPTACFGAGAGLAVGLVLYGVWMRLRVRGTGTPARPVTGPVRDTSRTGD